MTHARSTVRQTVLPFVLNVLQAVFFRSLNLLTWRPSSVRIHTVVFEPETALALDVYVPAAAANAAVVVFFYGGSWMSGKRQWYRWLGRTLARHGLVIVLADYRKWPAVQLDGFMRDAALAVAWTQASIAGYGGNARKVFLAGHSAGAHIGALLCTNAHWLAAVGVQRHQLAGFIGLAGPYDFLPLTRDVFIELFGSSHGSQLQSQPVHFVDGGEPPMLLLQGDADTVVGVSNAYALEAALNRKGSAVTVRIYPGVGHAAILLSLGPFKGRNGPKLLMTCLDFISAAQETAPVEAQV